MTGTSCFTLVVFGVILVLIVALGTAMLMPELPQAVVESVMGPTVTWTPTESLVPSSTSTLLPTFTATATRTVTLVPTSTSTLTPLPTFTATETRTATPSNTPTIAPTETPTMTPTWSRTWTWEQVWRFMMNGTTALLDENYPEEEVLQVDREFLMTCTVEEYYSWIEDVRVTYSPTYLCDWLYRMWDAGIGWENLGVGITRDSAYKMLQNSLGDPGEEPHCPQFINK